MQDFGTNTGNEGEWGDILTISDLWGVVLPRVFRVMCMLLLSSKRNGELDSRRQEVSWAGLSLPACAPFFPLESSLREVLAGFLDVWVWKATTNSPDDWYVLEI